VLFRGSVNELLVSVVAMWRLQSTDHDAGYAKWYADDNAELVDTADIRDIVTYTRVRGHLVDTLSPAEFM